MKMTIDIDKEQLNQHNRLELIGRSLNLAMMELGKKLHFDFDNASSADKLLINIETK